jgi:aminopeptidase N
MGEPQNGAWWFAANEIPRDKARFDVTVRVPRGVEAISNGALLARDAGRRWTSWHWRLDEPVATYMAFFAAGQFRLDRGAVLDVDGGERTFVYAVSRNLATDEQRTAMRKLRMTTDVVEWLGRKLGDHPYDDIGGLVTSIPTGYALETATRPVYPWGATRGGGWRTLLVHEQAHQWFGNDVALRRWQDIWLNEGFATYVEWWYDAAHGGPTVAERLEQQYDLSSAMSSFWDVRISDPGPAQMFSNPVYVRGAMTLAALRARVGDAHFATLLEQWLARHRGGHGTGTAFRALAEAVSAEDLHGFFQHWLDDEAKPADTAENGLG